MDKNCLYGILGLTGAIVLIVAFFLNYKIRVDEKHVKLEKQDREHEQKHNSNVGRISELEKKNGSEQHQIDELKEQVKQLQAIVNNGYSKSRRRTPRQ